jgi:hypothetical protein
MTDLPKAYLLPGFPFEAKARKKRRKGGTPAPATTRTPPFQDVQPFLSNKPLHGLTPRPAAPQPLQAENEPPTVPGTDHDKNIAA